METRARFILVGLFAVAVIAAGFLFVYWLNNGGRREGFLPGALRGFRLGFAARLRRPVQWDPRRRGDPPAIERRTSRRGPGDGQRGTDDPGESGHEGGIEFQGLLGAASVSLVGGASGAPLPAPSDGEAALLVADPAASRDLTGAAREILGRIDEVLAQNADPLHETLTSLGTFSGALARNADRVDTILSGLERLTGGGPAKPTPRVYDLAAPGLPPLDRFSMVRSWWRTRSFPSCSTLSGSWSRRTATNPPARTMRSGPTASRSWFRRRSSKVSRRPGFRASGARRTASPPITSFSSRSGAFRFRRRKRPRSLR